MNSRTPLVSVIMPVRNEEECIRGSIASVLAQCYPREQLELIVADGASEDATREILAEIAAADPRVRVIDNPGRIMATGFNAGLVVARGQVIVMMGGHAELCPDYVRSCVDLLAQGLAECVGGLQDIRAEETTAQVIGLATTSRFGVGGCGYRVGYRRRQYVDTVAFGVYTREAFHRAGPLDEAMVRNQDDEFNYRLRQLGGRILLEPQVRCAYRCRSSLPQLWKQYYRYGLWKVRVLQKHPLQMKSRHFAPLLFVLALLVGCFAGLSVPLARWGVVAVAGAYALANVGTSLLIAWRHNLFSRIAILSLAFAVMHLSYGIGFLQGLLKFHGGWRQTGRGGSPGFVGRLETSTQPSPAATRGHRTAGD